MSTERISIPVVVALAAALVVVAGAVVFGTGDQTRRLAESSLRLSHAERVLTAASLARSDLAITMTLIEAGNAELASGESVADAIESASVAIDTFLSETETLDAMLVDLQLASELTAVDSAWDQLEASLQARTGDVDQDTERFLEAVEATTGHVRDRRATLAAEVAAEGSAAGDLARVASFTVALIAPALAMWWYRRAGRAREERLRREEELRRREEVAAAKESLITGLSHELRTPLTAITGFSATACETLDEPPSSGERDLLREISGMVHTEAQELSRMVEDLLAAMRLGDGLISSSRSDVEVSDAVEAAVASFGEAGADVERILAPASVMVDAIQLRHVLRNVISNALRHGAGRRLILGEQTDSTYRLWVIDHGPGLPDGVDLDAPFAHDGYDQLLAGSIGIGLSVARDLASLMGTQLCYERDRGVTGFYLDLEVADAGEASPDAARGELRHPVGAQPNVSH